MNTDGTGRTSPPAPMPPRTGNPDECGKTKYSASDADRALRRIWQRRRHTRHVEQRRYWCDGCRAYHLTRIPKP